MNELNRERAGRCLAAIASPSYSADRSSPSPFNRCELVSRTQAAALRPGDQIAAPWRPGQGLRSVVVAGLVSNRVVADQIISMGGDGS